MVFGNSRYMRGTGESTSDLESILLYHFFLLELSFCCKSSPKLEFFKIKFLKKSVAKGFKSAVYCLFKSSKRRLAQIVSYLSFSEKEDKIFKKSNVVTKKKYLFFGYNVM